MDGLVGTLDDSALLIAQARAADAVIDAASSDHRGAVEALIEGLAGSGKVFLHTSGSSIVGDASGGEGTDRIYLEDQLPEPTADKAKRVAIDQLVLDSANRGVRRVRGTRARTLLGWQPHRPAVLDWIAREMLPDAR